MHKEDRDGLTPRLGGLCTTFLERAFSVRSSAEYAPFEDEGPPSLYATQDLDDVSLVSVNSQHKEVDNADVCDYTPPDLPVSEPTTSNSRSLPAQDSNLNIPTHNGIHEHGYAGYPSDLAGADTIAAIEPFTEPCSTAGQPEPWPVPAADQPAIEHRPLPVPKLRTVQRSTSDLQDFRISSNLGKYVERRLSHVSSSTNKPLNPRRASDSAEPSKTLHKHKPSDPLTIPKSVLQRIESLGPDLPILQQIILWIGIALDFVAKGSLVFELYRFGHKGHWLWFAFTTLFFCISSAVVSAYWWTHYPGAIADQVVVDVLPVTASQMDVNKKHKRIMRFGMLCATLQLGTAFAAFRALRSSKERQRLAAMDLRGMRLMDSVFLTLSVCMLQVYIGMRCTNREQACLAHRGFDAMLCAGAVASLLSSTLSFVTFEFNDMRLRHDIAHLYQVVLFFMFRILELGARICLLALFANVHGAWVYAVVAAHVVIVLLCLRFSPVPRQKKVWDKVMATFPKQLHLGRWRPTVHLPCADDIKLLVCCLAWPPSCYVSDATDKNGKFWWRGRMVGRLSCCEVRLGERLIAFPIYTFIVACETTLMLGVIWAVLPYWAHRYFGTTAVLQCLWALFGMLWGTSSIMTDSAPQPDALDRAIAIRDSMIAQECEVDTPEGQQDKEARMALIATSAQPCIGRSTSQGSCSPQKSPSKVLSPRLLSKHHTGSHMEVDSSLHHNLFPKPSLDLDEWPGTFGKERADRMALRAARPSEIGLLSTGAADSAKSDVEMGMKSMS